MISLFDKDNSGTINFDEFKGLFQYITAWKDAFSKFDKDKSNTIDSRELREAITGFGFNISDRTYNVIINKYRTKGFSIFIFR